MAFGLCRAIKLAFHIGKTANHRAQGTGLIVISDERTLGCACLFSIDTQPGFHGFFSRTLQAPVNRRVDDQIFLSCTNALIGLFRDVIKEIAKFGFVGIADNLRRIQARIGRFRRGDGTDFDKIPEHFICAVLRTKGIIRRCQGRWRLWQAGK